MDPAAVDRRRREVLDMLEQRRARYASLGWREILDRHEATLLFQRFNEAFFRTQRFVTPTPSITWDVRQAAHLPADSVEQLELMNDLHRKSLPALKLAAGAECWFALENFQHPCYQLDFAKMPDHIEEWPIELLPYRDPCFLVSPDFRSGMLARLRTSVTVFGEVLMGEIQRDPPRAFGDILQNNESDER